MPSFRFDRAVVAVVVARPLRLLAAALAFGVVVDACTTDAVSITGKRCESQADCRVHGASPHFCAIEGAAGVGVCMPDFSTVASVAPDRPPVGQATLILASVGTDTITGHLVVVDPDGDRVQFQATTFDFGALLHDGQQHDVLTVEADGTYTLLHADALAAQKVFVSVTAKEQTVSVAVLVAVVGGAGFHTWTGLESADWFATNWTTTGTDVVGAPGSGDSALVAGPAPHQPAIGAGAGQVSSLFITPDMHVTVDAAADGIDVFGTTLLAGGPINGATVTVHASDAAHPAEVAGDVPALVVDAAAIDGATHATSIGGAARAVTIAQGTELVVDGDASFGAVTLDDGATLDVGTLSGAVSLAPSATHAALVLHGDATFSLAGPSTAFTVHAAPPAGSPTQTQHVDIAGSSAPAVATFAVDAGSNVLFGDGAAYGTVIVAANANVAPHASSDAAVVNVDTLVLTSTQQALGGARGTLRARSCQLASQSIEWPRYIDCGGRVGTLPAEGEGEGVGEGEGSVGEGEGSVGEGEGSVGEGEGAVGEGEGEGQVSTCGDGIVEPPETCELTTNDKCRPDCTFCGDGVVQAIDLESCEPPNSAGCTSDCHTISSTGEGEGEGAAGEGEGEGEGGSGDIAVSIQAPVCNNGTVFDSMFGSSTVVVRTGAVMQLSMTPDNGDTLVGAQVAVGSVAGGPSVSTPAANTVHVDASNAIAGSYGFALPLASAQGSDGQGCVHVHVVDASLCFVAQADGVWTTPSVWDRNSVPSATDCAYIPSGRNVSTPQTTGIAIGELFVESGAKLIVPAATSSFGGQPQNPVNIGQAFISAGTINAAAQQFAPFGSGSVSGFVVPQPSARLSGKVGSFGIDDTITLLGSIDAATIDLFTMGTNASLDVAAHRMRVESFNASGGTSGGIVGLQMSDPHGFVHATTAFNHSVFLGGQATGTPWAAGTILAEGTFNAGSTWPLASPGHTIRIASSSATIAINGYLGTFDVQSGTGSITLSGTMQGTMILRRQVQASPAATMSITGGGVLDREVSGALLDPADWHVTSTGGSCSGPDPSACPP